MHQPFLKLLWIPDIFIDDVKKIKKYRLNNDYEGIIYWGDKHLVYYAIIEVVMYCPMVFEDYPLDSQICHFMLQSYHYRVPTLIFRHYAQITYCPKIDILIHIAPSFPQYSLFNKDFRFFFRNVHILCMAQ